MRKDNEDPEQTPAGRKGTNRRELLGGFGLAGLSATVPSAADAAAKPAAVHATRLATDADLQKHIQTVVVIYAENRSFNNLFADFPGLKVPLRDVPPERYIQRDRDGTVLTTLPKIWGGLIKDAQVVNHQSYAIGENDITGLPNKPFALSTPAGDPLPQGVVTRDLVHAFYQNQMQINGGKNDGFVAWGDTGAMVMGHYADNQVNLRLWQIARDYTLCDNFFMGAFGSSFLNHQYLIAATAPLYPDADGSVAKARIATVDGDPKGIDLRPVQDMKPSAMDGPARFGGAALTPDFFAVNTMNPPYAPSSSRDPTNPAFADPNHSSTLPAQTHATIGDRLSEKGIDWAWFSGGWTAALTRAADATGQFPTRPNFQSHHQPFNYFARFAPGTVARAMHLRDAGIDETSRTNRFLKAVEDGILPTVAYYKPQGNLNMHAGYSDVDSGDRHIATVIDALKKGPQWQNMMIIVTFDENGGWWDHVAPPKGDRWGPGTRIPAIVVSPFAKRGHVEHTVYDTGSISRFLRRRFGLADLPGLKERELSMLENAGVQPGDLTETLAF